MKKLTVKEFKNHLLKEYGTLKFDVSLFVKTCKKFGKYYSVEPIKVAKFMIGETIGIDGLALSSCGFLTANGRDFKENFEQEYKILKIDKE